MELEKLYTVEDVAKYTNLTSRTIRNYLKDGTLRGKKIGGQWRFTMEDIKQLQSDSGAVKEMINANDQNLIDFVNGTNTDITGELQICTVADYYCANVESASQLSQNFTDMIAQKPDDGSYYKYSFHYDTSEEKARYIFFGAPAFTIESMRILQSLWENLNLSKDSFSGKAESYKKGRPEYPQDFFEYLYGEFGMNKSHIIADIGSGVGKMSKRFLERGNKVFCVEPNNEMRSTADELLSHFKHYVPVAKSAEDTGINSNSVDFIICGNSYDYFDRNLSKPEFARILKNNGKIIITYYGPNNEGYAGQIDELNQKFAINDVNPIKQKNRNYDAVFKDGKYIEKSFNHTFFESMEDFLNGCLSYSRAPKQGSENYSVYYEGLREIFNKNQKDGKLKNIFTLKCFIGNVDDLV